MKTRQVHEIRMVCLSEYAAEQTAQYDPHLAGDTLHIVTADGAEAVIQFEDSVWPTSVAQSALADGHITPAEAERVTALAGTATSSLPQPATAPWEGKEKVYLALLDLAPQFDIPCRLDGAVRDISVSRHRNGPSSPWQWAIHRIGPGLTNYAWDGTNWWVVDRPVRLLNHAAWNSPMAALAEAQRLARQDQERGYTEVDRTQF